MLSRLGGAAMTSSGPACSLDRRSGNSRQDETHPDTLTAPALPTVTVGPEVLPRIFCLPQRVFVFLTLVVKTSDSGHKRRSAGYLGDSKTSCISCRWLCFLVVVFSVWVRKETKPKETAFVASSHWVSYLSCHCFVT